MFPPSIKGLLLYEVRSTFIPVSACLNNDEEVMVAISFKYICSPV